MNRARLAALHRDRAELQRRLAEIDGEIALELEDGQAAVPVPPMPLSVVLQANKALDRLHMARSVRRVYFIRQGSDGPIKIGFTTDSHARIASMQTSNPIALTLLLEVPGDEELEQRLHEEFSHLRIRGEWFEPGADLLAFIAGASKR